MSIESFGKARQKRAGEQAHIHTTGADRLTARLVKERYKTLAHIINDPTETELFGMFLENQHPTDSQRIMTEALNPDGATPTPDQLEERQLLVAEFNGRMAVAEAINQRLGATDMKTLLDVARQHATGSAASRLFVAAIENSSQSDIVHILKKTMQRLAVESGGEDRLNNILRSLYVLQETTSRESGALGSYFNPTYKDTENRLKDRLSKYGLSEQQFADMMNEHDPSIRDEKLRKHLKEMRRKGSIGLINYWTGFGRSRLMSMSSEVERAADRANRDRLDIIGFLSDTVRDRDDVRQSIQNSLNKKPYTYRQAPEFQPQATWGETSGALEAIDTTHPDDAWVTEWESQRDVLAHGAGFGSWEDVTDPLMKDTIQNDWLDTQGNHFAPKKEGFWKRVFKALFGARRRAAIKSKLT